jgi:hypothetical protein
LNKTTPFNAIPMGPNGVAACAVFNLGFTGIFIVLDCSTIELGFLLKVKPPKVVPL